MVPWCNIARRWLDVLIIAFLAWLLCLLFHKPLSLAAGVLAGSLGQWHFVIRHAMVAILAGFVWLSLVQLGGFRLGDLWSRSSLCYPPAWLGAILGMVLYVLVERLSFDVTASGRAAPVWSDWTTLALGIVIAYFIEGRIWPSASHTRRKEARPASRGYVPHSSSENEKSQPTFQWIETEQPIWFPNQDRFGAIRPARRICRHLLETPFKTIGILGAYGSGKTSVLNLVRYYLENLNELKSHLDDHQKNLIKFNPRRVVVCTVGAWGFAKGSATRHTLDCAVRELGKHIDTLAFADVPAHYQSAISESGPSWLKALTGLASMPHSPRALLSRIDFALGCAGMRLVVFLEDIERNTDDKTFLEEVGALLDHLRNLTNVSFILACGQEYQAAAMLARICELTEVLPSLTCDEVLKEVLQFRNSCRERYPDDMDCVPTETRDERFGVVQNKEIAALWGIRRIGPVFDIAALLANPRALKRVFRRVSHANDSLHGEIDFDDLFVANAVRIEAPTAFGFLSANFELFRKYPTQDQEQATEAIESNRSEANERVNLWNSFVQTVREEPGRWPLAKSLITFLVKRDERATQGVAKNTDYWVRLNAEEISNDELRDQTVLKAIAAWQSSSSAPTGDGSGLAELMLTNPMWPDKVEQLGVALAPAEVRSLAHHLFAQILQGKGQRVRRQQLGPEEFSGFIELWRLALKRRDLSHEAWVHDEIDKALAINLRFANDIFYYWCSAEQGIVDRDAEIRLREAMITKARALFEKDPELLISVLDSKYMYSLSHLMLLFSEPKYGGRGFRPDEWTWFSGSLLSAAKKNPQLLVPQIVALLSDGVSPVATPILNFHDDRAEAIFDDKLPQLMNALASDISVDDFSELERLQISLVQQHARDWLARQSAV